VPFVRGTRSRGSSIATRSRRQSSWSGGPAGAITRTGTGSSIFPVASQAIANGLTIVRTRGELIAYLTSATSTNDGYAAGFGICVVSENAAAVGITAVPTPITDIGWDGWLYHRLFQLKAAAPIAAGAAADTDFANVFSASVRIEVDSKAMRKIKATDQLIAVFEGTIVGTANLSASFDCRVLDKLA